jgi:type I restriction enzyme S subunit
MSKEKLIPEIRFPEYKNEGEWTEKKISELGETINGLTGKNGKDFGTGKSYVTYKQVFDNSVIDFQKCGKVEINDNENQNALQKGDILFTTSSETPNEVGFASVLVDSPKEDIYLNSFCFALRPFELEKTQPEFTRYLFHSPVYRKSVSAIAQGSTRYNLSKVAFLNLKVPIPKPKEQQKIASCLTSLDEVIAAHSQKLDLLKTHKKGLMQNLFPQEGEKVPKCRFKEFVNDGDWQENELNDFCLNISSGKDINAADGGFELYGSTGIIGKTKSASYQGDYILIARVGANAGLLNRAIGNFGVTDNTLVLNLKKIDSTDFIQYNLEKVGLNKLVFGSGQPLITGGQLKSLLLLTPKSDTEQQKIASCLSSLDALITAQAEKIEQLKLHKKGLMQGLFPKINN